MVALSPKVFLTTFRSACQNQNRVGSTHFTLFYSVSYWLKVHFSILTSSVFPISVEPKKGTGYFSGRFNAKLRMQFEKCKIRLPCDSVLFQSERTATGLIFSVLCEKSSLGGLSYKNYRSSVIGEAKASHYFFFESSVVKNSFGFLFSLYVLCG